MPQPRPSVEPTGATVLLIAGVTGAGLTWLALSAIEGLGWPAPAVPLLAAAVVAVLAVATWPGRPLDPPCRAREA